MDLFEETLDIVKEKIMLFLKINLKERDILDAEEI